MTRLRPSPDTLPVPSASALLDWYDRHRRSMPWRALPGERPDPYRVWLSEIMLQQTTVAAVIPYFTAFLERFPTVHHLAAAPSDAVMQAWAGLGYYARARNLHACAQQVAQRGGAFPAEIEALRELPGVGAYTAAAIGSIAFGVPVIPVDGNVERVAARIFAIDAPLPAAKAQLAAAAARLGDDAAARRRPADFTQALFDLGATICTPRNPACVLCPWRDACQARAEGRAQDLPVKTPRKARPQRYGAAFWLEDPSGRILLRRRPPKGLLGGMLELPGTSWRAEAWSPDEAVTAAPQPAPWRFIGAAHHGFTHFALQLDVFAARVPAIEGEGSLSPVSELGGLSLPSVMQRCVRLVLETREGAGSPGIKSRPA